MIKVVDKFCFKKFFIDKFYNRQLSLSTNSAINRYFFDIDKFCYR